MLILRFQPLHFHSIIEINSLIHCYGKLTTYALYYRGWNIIHFCQFIYMFLVHFNILRRDQSISKYEVKNYLKMWILFDRPINGEIYKVLKQVNLPMKSQTTNRIHVCKSSSTIKYKLNITLRQGIYGTRGT